MRRTWHSLSSLGFLVCLAVVPFATLRGQTGGTCEPIAQRG